ncbi:MAG: hypothetical protein ACKVW3_01285 [Phycisphaerales bacterium]
MAEQHEGATFTIDRATMHALRNELTAIVGLAEAIRHARDAGEVSRADALRIRESGLKAAAILKGLPKAGS